MSSTPRMHGLDYARLSNDTDESTSVERQHEQNGTMASLKDIDLIASLTDNDVSGAISPFHREYLGPWLTDPEKIRQWDVLIIAKLDRLTRSLKDFIALVEWCEENGKTLVSVAESLDLSTAAGRMVVYVLILFAQFERERTGERRAEAAEMIRKLGHWNGGPVNFGLRPEKAPGGGWELMLDPATAPIARQMAEMAISGKSAAAIGRWLDDNDIRTAQGGKQWRSSSVLTVLRNPGLRGYVVQTAPNGKGERFAEPKIIRDAGGKPVRRREAILDDDTWYRLQAALDAMTKPHTSPRSDAHPLLGVGFCGKCGAPLYSATATNKRRSPPVKVKYYACSNRRECHARGIEMDDLDARVEAEIIARYSGTPYPEKIITPGVDHTRELAALDAQIAELDGAFKQGEVPARAYGRLVTDLETARETLEAEQTPGGVDYRAADDTIAERFMAADLEGRRAILLDLGISVHAVLTAGKQPAYEKMAAELRGKILSGDLAPGARLPSRKQLGADYGLSTNPAARALAILISEGLVRCDGHRWFVTSQVPEISSCNDIYDGRVIDVTLTAPEMLSSPAPRAALPLPPQPMPARP